MTIHHHTPDYWVSYLAMTIACALSAKSPTALKPALQAFMRSPAADHIRADLVKEVGYGRARENHSS